MIKACIFDLDGVLVDTARYHYIAWKRLANELGVDLSEQHNERLKGVSRMRSLEIILELAGKTFSDANKESMADRKNGWFVEYINSMKPDEIFPGVKTLIEDLRGKNIKVALASSSRNAKTVLRLLNIEYLFDTIVDGSMVEHAKPDPEIFLLAARRLGVDPQACVVFEDAEAGVEAAINAGMKCVGVGLPEQLNKANLVVARTADIDVKKLFSL